LALIYCSLSVTITWRSTTTSRSGLAANHLGKV